MTAVTREQIDTLVKVQQIEIETGKLKVYLEKVPSRISSLERELEEFIHSVEGDEAEIEEFNKQYRALEADVQLNLSKPNNPLPLTEKWPSLNVAFWPRVCDNSIIER